MSQIFMLTVPLFVVIGIGYLLAKFHLIKSADVHFLNRLVYVVSLPAIIFSTFVRIDWSKSEMLSALLYNTLIVLMFMLFVLGILSLLRVKRSLRGPIAACAVVGNTVYMGFPLGAGFFSTEYAPQFYAAATPHLVIGIAFAVLVIEYYAEHQHSFVRFTKDFATNPLIISLVLGIIVGSLGVADNFLGVVMKPIDMLGNTASPLALITLGAFLAGKFRKVDLHLVSLAAFLKLIAFPISIYLIGYGVSAQPLTLSAAILAGAMPTAVTVFSLSDRYHAHSEFVGNTILATTLTSFITITIVLSLLTLLLR